MREKLSKYYKLFNDEKVNIFLIFFRPLISYIEKSRRI